MRVHYSLKTWFYRTKLAHCFRSKATAVKCTCNGSTFVHSNLMKLNQAPSCWILPKYIQIAYIVYSGFRIWIRINLSCWIRSRRAKMTHKYRKMSKIFMFLSAVCSLLRAEGFSCSLGVLYGGLGISKLQFLIKKIEIKIKFPAINFFFNFRSSNPGSAIRKNAGSGSALNQCGSETQYKISIIILA